MRQVVSIGALVRSPDFSFDGIAKVLELNENCGTALISFFYSPLEPEARQQNVLLANLQAHRLELETPVYIRDSETGIWQLGRYAGERPDGLHLIQFHKASQVVESSALYVQNNLPEQGLDPAAFLAGRTVTRPKQAYLREEFLSAWYSQRSAADAMSAVSASSVSLEPHQLAVVRRVLDDPHPHYLLADEVGLGKTVEAGILIREFILRHKAEETILVAVPDSLVGQWTEELTDRFDLLPFLRDLDDREDETAPLIICGHQQLTSVLDVISQPAMVVIDEAHQIAPMAWSGQPDMRRDFASIAAAANNAEMTLLLSGTPMNGNERNYLAMLHCLNPDAWPLTDEGVELFSARSEQREQIGGIYSALTPDNSNAALEAALDDLEGLFPADAALQERVSQLRPEVDFFAEESGAERARLIMQLRHFVGENYRLHQRLLRNRREHQGLDQLFPGLDGLEQVEWRDTRLPTVDEALEEYRAVAVRSPEIFKALTAENYLHWLDDLLNRPASVASRVRMQQMLLEGELHEEERELLAQLLQSAEADQLAKDEALGRALRNWLEANPKGQAVVFCNGSKAADGVSQLLAGTLGAATVERHQPGQQPDWISQKARVLICDERGEDGLNLHGGQKLVVHYSLSRTFSRLEQRLGRVNRYSANLRGVKPVNSMVLMPPRQSISQQWIHLLDETVELFNHTVASLQYVLERWLAECWQQVTFQGGAALEAVANRLAGDDGELARERKRVRAQEQLETLETEIADAREFADRLADSDESSEAQGMQLVRWLTHGLKFRAPLDAQENVSFRYVTGEREDSPTRLTRTEFMQVGWACIGKDNHTTPMNLDRDVASATQGVQPLRFGNPFVDGIRDLMYRDLRGASSLFLRVVPGVDQMEPRCFFRLDWELSSDSSESADSQYRHQWLGMDGEPAPEQMQSIVALPFKAPGSQFQDIEASSDIWQALDTWLPADAWQDTVLTIRDCGRKRLAGGSAPKLLGMHAVLLCGRHSFQ